MNHHFAKKKDNRKQSKFIFHNFSFVVDIKKQMFDSDRNFVISARKSRP